MGKSQHGNRPYFCCKATDLSEEEGKTFRKRHVLGMNDDLWDRFHGLGSETWKGSE